VKQVFLSSTGKVVVEDVLEPSRSLQSGFLRVKVRSSLISSGTDRALISGSGSGSVIKKVGRNPELLKKVFDLVSGQGVKAAQNVAIDKLYGRTALGYSCAGEILACGDDTPGFNVGDKVACAGVGYANHAEIVTVPSNLTLALPSNVDFDAAAFVALGAIAQHGLRQASINYGENLLVLGLGLVGQLVVQQAKAAGLRVAGADLAEERLHVADLGSTGIAVNLKNDHGEQALMEWTSGRGFDSVVVTASDDSSAAFATAGRLVKDRGTISLVGVVGLPAESTFFLGKEITVRGARSYGPGRYDPTYEEKGLDYPFNYVRWTEKRIMEFFLESVNSGAVQLAPLITNRFAISDAAQAYKLVEEAAPNTFAVIIDYPGNKVTGFPSPHSMKLRKPRMDRKFKIGVWGIGAFAREAHLPNLAKQSQVELMAVGSSSGANATQAAKRYGAAYSFSDFQMMLEAGIDGLVLSGRHNEHAANIISALEAGVSVFVEKPLSITLPELTSVQEVWRNVSVGLMVGHNRKFSNVIVRLKKEIEKRQGPLSLLYRISPGPMKNDHWMLDRNIGGGRLVSELSHFVDTCMFIVGSAVTRVSAHYADQEKMSIQGILEFVDGSTACVAYLPHGDKTVGKEYLEVHSAGRTLRMNDYLSLTSGKNDVLIKNRFQEKGYVEELDWFLGLLSEPRSENSKVLTQQDIEATRVMFELIASAEKNNKNKSSVAGE
jgi:predicted dehydrogenase/threonine dehydrogenase-like Zn-dependent dehydrogenase